MAQRQDLLRLRQYFHAHGRFLLAATVVLFAAVLLPRWQVFPDRDPGMLDLHLLEELFAIVVSVMIATIAWYQLEQRSGRDSGLLLTGFTAVAITDLAHALTYDGMPRLIVATSTQRALYFWLFGRSIALATLLLMAAGVRAALPRVAWLAIGVGIALAVFALGTWGIDDFPALYVQGFGLSALKRGWDYVLVVFDLTCAALFILRPGQRPTHQVYLFATSSLVMGMSELAFSAYKVPSDFLSVLGHVYKIMAYACLFQALFVAAIRAPYAQIRASEGRFRALAELSTDWYWKVGLDLGFTEVSSGATRFTSLPMLGKPPWHFAPRHSAEAEWKHFRRACAAGEAMHQIRLPFQADSGEVRWFSVSSSPLHTDDGARCGFQGVCTDISDRVRYEREMEQLAYRHPLTGLPNRLLVAERLATVRLRLAGDTARIAFLVINVDNFQSFNEPGHTAGDTALRTIALRLSATLPDPDIAGHLDSDEFVALAACPNGRRELPLLANRLMAAVRRPMVIDGRECEASVSIGIAVYPDDGENFETLRRCADAAMRRAKGSGKDTFRIYDDSLRQAAMNRLGLRNELRQAIDQRQFELHYQPQFDLHSGRIIGAEALLRWNHPDRGLVTPLHFISAAEESGLIIPIGRMVLNAACRQGAEWIALGLPPMSIAVNCSALQFQRGTLAEDVGTALRDSRFPVERLELELTESILIQDTEQMLASARALTSLGVKLAIDDFGTGVSNFHYLRRLGISKLKIDQRFVRDMLTSNDDAVIVATVIQLARRLGMVAIAEGVESAEIAGTLTSMGCPQAQGYHFGRPVNAEEFTRIALGEPAGGG